jgi:uncharacterized membrane protein YqjE
MMRTSLIGPLATLAVAALVVLVAVLLDRGSPRSRDAALIVGSLGLYVLLPLAAIWLFVTLVLRRRHRGQRP